MSKFMEGFCGYVSFRAGLKAYDNGDFETGDKHIAEGVRHFNKWEPHTYPSTQAAIDRARALSSPAATNPSTSAQAVTHREFVVLKVSPALLPPPKLVTPRVPTFQDSNANVYAQRPDGVVQTHTLAGIPVRDTVAGFPTRAPFGNSAPVTNGPGGPRLAGPNGQALFHRPR